MLLEYAGASVLKEFAGFIQESNTQLRDVEEAIGYMKYGSWDAIANPVFLKVSAFNFKDF